jgi:hypothetical protein
MNSNSLVYVRALLGDDGHLSLTKSCAKTSLEAALAGCQANSTGPSAAIRCQNAQLVVLRSLSMCQTPPSTRNRRDVMVGIRMSLHSGYTDCS